jgi:hypothetical protein
MFVIETPIPHYIEILQEVSALEHTDGQTLPPHYEYKLHLLYKECVGMYTMINVRLFSM